MNPWIVLVTYGLLCGLIVVIGADNLALLSGTLRTYQRAGCDNDVVTLRCPPGTSISIEVAQYGKSAPAAKALCGGSETGAGTPVVENGLVAAGTVSPPSAAAAGSGKSTTERNVSCLLSNALQTKWEEVAQGTWGRTVVEACQKKPQCKFQTSPKVFGGDPCPGVRKYVEVAYKCRPYEFRSKIACENEKIQLKCNPNARVAVYSASYGRTEYESIQCPQTQGVSEETCLVSYATETVMQICHGKRSCDLTADASTFGNPCQPKSRMYLKVVYTCVPRKVLKEQYEGRLEPDELQPDENAYDEDLDYENYDAAGNEFIRESAASPPASNTDEDGFGGNAAGNNLTRNSTASGAKMPPHTKDLDKVVSYQTLNNRNRNPFRNRNYHHHHHHQRPSNTVPLWAPTPTVATVLDAAATDTTLDPANCTTVTVYVVTGQQSNHRVIGFISNWINTYTFIAQNRERFYLYLIVSVGSGILLCLIVLVVRLLVQRRRDKNDAKFHVTNITDHALPNGFSDDISEVDADIDLSTPLPVPPTMGTISEVVRYPHHVNAATQHSHLQGGMYGGGVGGGHHQLLLHPHHHHAPTHHHQSTSPPPPPPPLLLITDTPPPDTASEPPRSLTGSASAAHPQHYYYG